MYPVRGIIFIMKVIVSACLVGLKTRYDGKTEEDPEIVELFSMGDVIPVCPEQLGGLPTPREPVHFKGGDGKDVLEGKAKVVGVTTGEDKTENMLRGANEVLKIVEMLGIKKAILKEKSPSCGLRCVMIDGEWKKGMGVTTALLIKNGIEVETRD